MTHSPEPWRVTDYQLILDRDDVPVINGDCDDSRWPDDGTCERIVACVNACAGIPTPALEAIGRGEARFMLDRFGHTCVVKFPLTQPVEVIHQ